MNQTFLNMIINCELKIMAMKDREHLNNRGQVMGIIYVSPKFMNHYETHHFCIILLILLSNNVEPERTLKPPLSNLIVTYNSVEIYSVHICLWQL